jgi:hypothetical protein
LIAIAAVLNGSDPATSGTGVKVPAEAMPDPNAIVATSQALRIDIMIFPS